MMCNSKDVINVMDSVKFMAEVFGEREFTSKEWKNTKKEGMCLLDTLQFSFYSYKDRKRHNLVEKVRVEKFSTIVEARDWDFGGADIEFIFNSKGEKVMRKTDFDRLDYSVKNMMETVNGGKFTVASKRVKVVEGERYYYRLNLNELPFYVEVVEKNIEVAIKDTEKAYQKLLEKQRKLENTKILLASIK